MTCIGQLETLLAFDELAPEFLLQSGYLVAQCLLRDVEPFGCTCDVAFRGCGEKVFQVLKVHGQMINQRPDCHKIFIVESIRNKVFVIVIGAW